MDSKPIKVCDADRKKKIGITASALSDVKEKVKKYYGITDNSLKIVEESDGTVIKDNEYLKTLPDYVLLMVLKDKENWSKRQDVPFFSTQEIDETDSVANKLHVVARSITRNPVKIPLLKKDELQLLADATPEELVTITKMQPSEVNDLQEYCCRRLRDDDELKDGIELLRLYNQSNKLK